MNDNNAQNTVSPEKLRKVMDLIANLMARADHPNTPPEEAATARARAEREMQRYRIDEANLDATEKAKMGIKPTHRLVKVAPLRSEFLRNYSTMLSYVMSHCDAIGISKWETDETGTTWQVVDMFGFESDLGYAELLWNSIRAAFADRLEPAHDPSLSDEDNVYRMRNAGMERGRIGEVMGWGGEGTQGPNKVTRVFKKACAARGESPQALSGKGNNMRTFRSSYAEAFADEMWDRMWQLRTARGQVTGALVLKDRIKDVKELMYTVYPQMRPVPLTDEERARIAAQKPKKPRKPRKPVERPVNWDAARRGAEAARSVDIGSVGGSRLPS